MIKGSASFGVELSDPVGQVIYRYLNIYGPSSGSYLIWVAGYKLSDTGCWFLDTGYWMLDTGYWMLVEDPEFSGDTGCSLLVASIGRIVVEN